MKKRTVDDFLPRIFTDINGPDADMVRVLVMDAVIQFVKDTNILREIVCITLDPCLQSYLVETKYRVNKVLSFSWFVNNQRRKNPPLRYYLNEGVLYLPQPAEGEVELELAVLPHRDDTDVPEFIYEDWVEAITTRVLARLFLMPDAEWYNPQAAASNLTLYNAFVEQAKSSSFTKHRALSNIKLKNKGR